MLQEKVLEDYKAAMKQKDSLKVTTLSSLRAQFNYAALEKKKDNLEDADCISVIKKIIKQHQDSIEQFKNGNRLDLVEKEEKEMQILKSYLPEELSAEEICKIIESVVSETAASGMKDMGKVMKEVNAKTGGRADGRVVSELVRKRLTQAS